jgi:hypothetical protein
MGTLLNWKHCSVLLCLVKLCRLFGFLEFNIFSFFSKIFLLTLNKLWDKCSIVHFPTRILSHSIMDHLHYRLNFDLNMSRQKFHHSLKEHHKISNIPKFRCEMLYNMDNITLRNLQFSVILYYKREIDAPTPDWAVNFPCVIKKYWKTANFARLYYAHFTTFRNETLESWQTREAQIETQPFEFECEYEWAFRFQALVSYLNCSVHVRFDKLSMLLTILRLMSGYFISPVIHVIPIFTAISTCSKISCTESCCVWNVFTVEYGNFSCILLHRPLIFNIQ